MLVALLFAFALDCVDGKGYSGGSGYHSSGYSGRSGYGGGVTSGGGWYWFHNRNNDDTGDNQYESEQGNSAFTNFLIAVLIILGVLGCFYQKLSRQGRLLTIDPQRNEGLLGKEPAALTASCLSDPQFYSKPANGVYCTSYMEPSHGLRPSRKCNGEINIVFHKQNGGWKMSGDGSDADGRFVIKDGCVALDGRAFWREVGPGNRSVANTGRFHFTTHTFQGTWLADNGRGDEYIDFYHKASRLHGGPNKILSVNKSYAPPPWATADTSSSRNTCQATNENGNPHISSIDAKQGQANAASVDGSRLNSKSHGAYVSPIFVSTDKRMQQSHVNCPAPLTPCVAPRLQQSVVSATTHPYQSTTEPGAHASRPISYISSVSSEDTFDLPSESMSYSGTIGSQRSRQTGLSPSIPRDEDVKDVEGGHA